MDSEPNLLDLGKEWTEGREKAALPTRASKFSLSEQAADWHFFNHGALFRFGGLTFPNEDPVSDWFHQQSIGTEVLRQPFRKPVLDGLTNDSGITGLTWDNLVFAVRHEYWQSLWEFLGGVVTLDSPARRYCQVFSGDIAIVDPVFAERHSVMHPDLPAVKLTVFCIDANTERWEIHPARTIIEPPRFVRVSPRPEVITMADALLSGKAEALKHKDNPAFQPLLDKYAAISKGVSDESANGDAQHRQR